MGAISAYAMSVMAMYHPDELARFYAIWEPTAVPVPTISHDEVLRQRAQLAVMAKEAAALEGAPRERTPEAVCRGYSMPGPALPRLEPESRPAANLAMPGDQQVATRSWLRFYLGNIPGFEGVPDFQVVKDHHLRLIWRAAAGLLAMQRPARIESPANYLVSCVSGIEAGHMLDRRHDATYQANPKWPRELLVFANVGKASP